MDMETSRPSFAATIWADMENFASLKGTSLRSVGGVLDVLFFPGVMAVILFRLSSVFHRAGLRPISRLLYILNVVLFGADLAPGMQIGPGLALPHPVGVIIGAGVRMGRNVRVFGGAQLGGAAYEDRSRDGFPVVGDECWIFGGAKVLGPIAVGDHAMVAAGALVLQAVPAGGIVTGIPARFQRYRDGFDPAALVTVLHANAEVTVGVSGASEGA